MGGEIQSLSDRRPDVRRRLDGLETLGNVHQVFFPVAAALIHMRGGRAPALETAARRAAQRPQHVLRGEAVNELGVVRFHFAAPSRHWRRLCKPRRIQLFTVPSGLPVSREMSS